MKFKKNLDEVIKRNKKLWSGYFMRGILAKIDIDCSSTIDLWGKALQPQYCPNHVKMFDVFWNFLRKENSYLMMQFPVQDQILADQ